MIEFIGGAFCGAVIGFMIGAILGSNAYERAPRHKEPGLPHHRNSKVIALDKTTRDAQAEAWWMK